MSAFKPGDRVRYVGKSPIYNKTRVGKVGEFILDTGHGCGTILLEGDRDQCSVYLANLELATPEPKEGDRVRVTIEGVVSGASSVGTVRVSPDGARTNYDNVIDTTARGVTVETVEPEYKAGTVVKDARGLFYQRHAEGWQYFGSVNTMPHHRPVRPLTVVS